MLDHLANKTIVLVTEAINGLGDFFAAKKLVHQLQQAAPSTRVYWYVYSLKTRTDVQKHLDEARAKFGDSLDIKLLYANDKMDLNNCPSCDLVLFFPTIHYLQFTDFQELKRYNAPIMQMYEYDGVPELHGLDFRSELVSISTGFNGLGINLEDLQQRKLPKPDFYDPKRITLFSYLNLASKDCVNQSTLSNYLHIAFNTIHAEKSVDLITNSSFANADDAFYSLVWSHGFAEIKLLSKDKQGRFQEQVRRSPRGDAATKQLRIIQSFPLSNTELLGALAVAHPFVQVTGDQSLSELMSFASIQKDIVPFYQIMFWKNALHEHWLEYATNCLGKESPYLILLQKLSKDTQLDVMEFSEYWRNHQKAILADSRSLYSLLKKEKDLTRNGVDFLDLVFYIKAHLPETEFGDYCLLAAQLVTKMGDNKIMQQFLHELAAIQDPAQRHYHLSALTEFLTLNSAPISRPVLEEVSKKLLTLAPKEQVHAARNLRLMLAKLPAALREQWVIPMFSDLLNAATFMYPYILQKLGKIDNFSAVDANPTWFRDLVNYSKQYEALSEGVVPMNAILFGVDVFIDGVGDLAKFIGIYQVLRMLRPTTQIVCLIHCRDSNRHIVLTMLRENNIPLCNSFICSFSELEYTANTLFEEHNSANLENKYRAIGCRPEKYALYISVATPFPSINSIFRPGYLNNAPYLEIAEVEYASYATVDQHSAKDSSHHLVSMGLDRASVGIEITEVHDKSAEAIINTLSPTLKSQLLDGDSPNQFTHEALFMPAYVKNDRGILSLYYLLALSRHAYPDKRIAAIWLHTMPCDLQEPRLQAQLKQAGFSQIVLYDVAGQRKQISIENPIANRQLRIMTGRVEYTDFDLLFHLASKMGGFAGCTGQNSFEKSVSFSLIPAFSAPSWQIPIISQTRSVVASLFTNHSAEYLMLIAYLDMLQTISVYLNHMHALEAKPELKPYLQQLKNLSHRESIREVKAYSQKQGYQQSHLLGDTCPVELVEQFFNTYSLEDLKSSWALLCNHIKQHKNLNTWLANKVQELMPQPERLAPFKNDSGTEQLSQVLYSNAHSEITPETLPQTAKLIHQLLNETGYLRKINSLRFILTDSKSLFMDNVAGLREPTIAISMQAWSMLTVAEIRFGLRFCIGISDIYPIENSSLDLYKLSHNELLGQVKGDQVAGISYCRKLIQTLRVEKDLYLKDESKPQRFYDLSRAEEFYLNLIKEIEIHLAKENKRELQSAFAKPQDAVIDAQVLEELKRMEASWQALSKIPMQKTSILEQLDYLLSTLPNLRIKDFKEYEYPNFEALNYLKNFDEIVIDTSNKDQVHAVQTIVYNAYTNCVPIFTKLYLSACNKLYNGKVEPMGPFKVLLEHLQHFMRATTQESAATIAKQIQDFFLNPAYAGLFHASDFNLEYTVGVVLNLKQPNIMLCSTIGARIKWEESIGLDFWKNLNRLRSLALSAHSTDIAKVLFSLGDISYKPLWDLLPNTYITNPINNRDCIILGEIPKKYSYNGMSNDIKEGLDTPFYTEFLRYKHFKNFHPCEPQLSIGAIESFIHTNKAMLALSNIDSKASGYLTGLFEVFLREQPELAQPFISRFFCDSSYEFGIYELQKLAKTIGFPHMTRFGESSINSDRAPFMVFLEKHSPDYIPMPDLLECIHENFQFTYQEWPIHYFFKIFKLRIDVLEDVVTAINKFTSHASLLSSDTIKQFLTAAIGNSYAHAAKHVDNIPIFSKVFADFIAGAEKSQNANDSYKLLWERKDFVKQIINPPTKMAIGAVDIATTYQILDKSVTWPKSEIRDRFSKIVLNAIREDANYNESEQACATLLFSKRPLTDMVCIKELMKIWVAHQVDKYGLDDASYSYFQKLSYLVSFIARKCPSLYIQDLLESLSVGILAQDKLCELIDQQLNASRQNQLISSSEFNLVKCARGLAEANVSLDCVAFLSYELTQNSLKTFVSKLGLKAREALAKKRIDHGPIDDQKAEVLATFFYHSFWGLHIEERAVIINNLLIPSTRVTTEADANKAFQEALDFIIQQLFPIKNNESNLSIALLKSYLNTSHEHVRPYLLTAILTANRLTEGNQKSIATTLPKLAEALGAAGVKAGQAAHSFPNTPEHIREGLSYLKSQARIPYRWELWKLLKKAIPQDLLLQIDKMQGLLGGASFYLAVQVLMKNGDVRVLRLLREDAKNEASTGFRHMKATLNHCEHPDIHKIGQDLKTIIEEAEKGALVEIDHTCAQRQYLLANRIYNKAPQTVISNGAIYHIKMVPVSLYSVGESYQLISKAEGIEFNTLKKQPTQLALYQAVATAIYKMELELMLAGKPCDFDRHGAQTRITWRQVQNNEYEVTVVHYDFGEVAPEEPTQMQLFHCKNFINELSNTLFSSQQLLQFMSGAQDASAFTSQLSKQMLDYIRRHEQQGTDNEELSRLRGIFKGMLALNDYFEAIPKTTAFLLELNALFNKYNQSASVVSNLLGFFARASIPVENLQRADDPGRRL